MWNTGRTDLNLNSLKAKISNLSNLCQQYYSLSIWPDHMIHLWPHPLPGQFRGSQTGLKSWKKTVNFQTLLYIHTWQKNWVRAVSSPHQSQCLSGPCCRQYSRSSCGPCTLLLPRFYCLRTPHTTRVKWMLTRNPESFLV